MLCPVTCTDCSATSCRDDCCLDGGPALDVCVQCGELHVPRLLPPVCESCEQPLPRPRRMARRKSA